jgi:hypothetical protein
MEVINLKSEAVTDVYPLFKNGHEWFIANGSYDDRRWDVDYQYRPQDTPNVREVAAEYQDRFNDGVTIWHCTKISSGDGELWYVEYREKFERWDVEHYGRYTCTGYMKDFYHVIAIIYDDTNAVAFKLSVL